MKSDYSTFSIIERKVFRKIFGSMYGTEIKNHKRKHNADVQNIYRRPNILSFSRSRRIEWFGCVWRVDGKVIQHVKEIRIIGKRPMGRPETQWKNVMERQRNDLQK